MALSPKPEPPRKQPQISWRRAMLVGLTVVVLIAIVLVLLVSSRTGGLNSPARRQWRDEAVAQIEQRLAEGDWLARELERLSARASAGGWAGDELLLMRNGEWILCRSICQKEDSRIPDLFIGRSSDGRWYYSTFHFCIDRLVLRMELQPQSIDEFVRKFSARSFDGTSDQSLQSTWKEG